MDDPLNRFEQVDAVFAAALDRAGEERAAFLDEACAGDFELRAAVERLLRASEADDEKLIPGGGLQALDWEGLAAGRDEADPVPGSKLGPYEVVGPLGEGGMGKVFRARDTRLQREVALKVLDIRARADSQIERFGREARAASALNHPNIVTIYDIGSTDEVSYIAMEYVEGQSLRERIASRPLGIGEALGLAEQIASGLAAAHQKGIVHRDLKPANVMIAADGTAKIVDFGLAKMDARARGAAGGPTRTEPLTAEGIVFGTVGYMSPEQARGERLDYRSDLFSFGALLYEMLAGKRAFARSSTAEVLAAILKEPPRPIVDAAPDAPPTLHAAVERCLRKDRRERYESTLDLARDLRAARELHERTAASSVRCAACGGDNPRGHRFCSRCGAGLRQPCPGCGTEIAVDSVFCGSCGHGLGAERTARRGEDQPTRVLASGSAAGGEAPRSSSQAMASERRQATILITRLVDYESMLEQALPEDVERRLADLERSACEVIDRYGGRVDPTAPDEIVAVFGIPVTHEDDALRAVRAALELHELQPRLCSAIHTGLVVVHDASGPQRGPRAVGEAANVARALCQRAAAGHVVVSPESRRLAGAGLRTEPLKPLRLRPGGDPVVPQRVIEAGETAVPPLEVSDAPLTEFAGRQGELGTIMDCVEAAVGGEGRVVAVVGEAGAGKSRLFYELRRQLDRARLTLVEGRCQSYGERAPYLPLIQACRAVLQVADEDPPEVRLRHAVERVRAIDSDLEPLLPLYLHLLSIPSEQYPLPEHLEGKPFRPAMQEALVALFTLTSRRGPLVLILEDWHWVDEASHDAVRQLAEMCPDYPLLVAVSYRPEVSPDWGALGHLRTVQLAALGPLSSAAIMRSVLGAEQIPDDLAALVHERTGGNPFFLEEVCRTLREEGAVCVEDGEARVAGSLQRLRLPESVQAVIRTRLDRIEPGARDLLRRASVVGREFSLRVLEQVADDVGDLEGLLHLLKERGLVRQARVLPEPVYRFQHALTQEVAYGSLLQRQRKDLHGRVGEAVERVGGETREESYDVLARHFAEAERWTKAVRYGRLSAHRARSLSQFADALTALQNTRDWLDRLPDGEEKKEASIELLREEVRVSEVVGDRRSQQRAVDELLTLLETDGDRPELVGAYLGQAELLALAKDFDGGLAALRRALAVSRRLADADLERDALRSLAFLHWQRPDYEAALEALDKALAIDRDTGNMPRIVGDLTNRASVLRGLGRYDEALESVQEALQVADRPGAHVHRLGEALYVAFTIYRDLGRTEEGEVYLHRSFDELKEDRSTIHQPFRSSALANILLERGEVEEALDLLRHSVQLSRESRYAFGLSQCQRNLANVLLGLGRDDEALPHLLEAAEAFGRLRDRDSERRMLAAAAPILERRNEAAEARSCWERVAAAPAGDELHLAALRGLARLDEAAGEIAAAGEHLSRALAACTDDGAARADLLNDLGILEWKRGRFEQALGHYREALAIFERLHDPVHAGVMLNSIGASLKPLGRFDEAREALDRALDLLRQSNEHRLAGHSLALLGDVASEQGDLDAALGRYRESLQARRYAGDRQGEGWMRYRLARTLLSSGERDRAEENAALAAAIATEIGDEELGGACRALDLG